MRHLRRIISLLIIAIMVPMFILAPTPSAYELVPIPRASGNGYVTYRNQSIQVKMPDEYVAKEAEFRGMWVARYGRHRFLYFGELVQIPDL